MVNEREPRMLTVRELRETLNEAQPDQVVIFSLKYDDLAGLQGTVPDGMGVVFAVKVDLASLTGPVFRLTSVGPHQPRKLSTKP